MVRSVAAARKWFISGSGPFVLVLDNVQWADPSSLELMASLVVSSPIMVIGTCRGNEVSYIKIHWRFVSEIWKIGMEFISPTYE